MGRPMSLKGHSHTCPIHGGGPIVQTQSFVTVDGVPVATVSSLCLCGGTPTDPIVQGSSVLSIEGRKVARQGDATGHGGRIIQGLGWLTVE